MQLFIKGMSWLRETFFYIQQKNKADKEIEECQLKTQGIRYLMAYS